MKSFNKNTKRPHTLIKNIIEDFKTSDKWNQCRIELKNSIKGIDYFSLGEIDFIIMRLFLLNFMIEKDIFIKEEMKLVSFYNINRQSYNINLILRNKIDKKKDILKFLNELSYKEETKRYLINLEKEENGDFLKLLKFCEI